MVVIAAVLATITGCNHPKEIMDYRCGWYYKITNQTDSDVVYVDTYDNEAIFILPNETVLLARHQSSWCQEGYFPPDAYEDTPDELMQFSECRLMVNDEFMPEAIWTRHLWGFANEPYAAVYTLTLTDQLIESLKYPTN